MPSIFSKSADDFINAVKNNEPQVVSKILEKNKIKLDVFSKIWRPPNNMLPGHYTAMIYVAFQGYTDVLHILIQHGAHVNKANNKEVTPLHCAAFNGHTATVRVLLDANADVNQADNRGRTPLYLAACYGHTATVRVLLDANVHVNKADVNKADNDGVTPLHWAAVMGHTATVQVLLDANADVNKANISRVTPLHWAAMRGHTPTVRVLLDANADVNKADNSGMTPLHWAARWGRTTTVRCFLQNGADAARVDRQGRTPLQIAEQHGHYDTAKAIRQYLQSSIPQALPEFDDSKPDTDEVVMDIEDEEDLPNDSTVNTHDEESNVDTESPAVLSDEESGVPSAASQVQSCEGTSTTRSQNVAAPPGFVSAITEIFINEDRTELLLPEYHLSTNSNESHDIVGLSFKRVHDPSRTRYLPTGTLVSERASISMLSSPLITISGRPTEKELSSIAQHTGFEWLRLAVELDIGLHRTDQIQMKHVDPHNRILEMLVQWRTSVQDKSEQERTDILKKALSADTVGRCDLAVLL